MCAEARDLWSQKKCPFGVGDDSGKCCTSDCAAWKEWDTRETVVDRETRWEDSKPGWFSDWSVEAVEGHDGYHAREVDPSSGEGVHFRVPGNKRYLWVKKTYRNSGGAGGRCGRL